MSRLGLALINRLLLHRWWRKIARALIFKQNWPHPEALNKKFRHHLQKFLDRPCPAASITSQQQQKQPRLLVEIREDTHKKGFL